MCDNRYFFFFFFSSRRRHTRYWRDWSSDVCSSDLAHPAGSNGTRSHTSASNGHHPNDAASNGRRPSDPSSNGAQSNAPAADDEFAEWDSVETIDAVANALSALGDVIRLEANANFPQNLRDSRVDIVFNIAEGLHGV